MSTNRAQLRAGCKTVIDTVKAANPTLVDHVYSHRPNKVFGKALFIDNTIDQPNILHDASTRRTEMTAFVHVVSKLITNDQAADEQDALVDIVVDAFTAAPRAASAQSLIEPIGVTGHEEDDGEAHYACSIVAVRGLFAEGRL